MANEFRSPHLIATGDAKMIVSRNAQHDIQASLQIIADGSFNGTTSQAYLVQSNDLNLNFDDWNLLPEDPLTLIVGSNLLQTKSFVCKYLGVVITKGDASAGSLKLLSNFFED